MQTIRIGHSPDPDDAFMFYALTAGKVRIPGVGIEHVLEDIESLNRRARTAELEVTAVSFATYLLVADRYRMMDPGASMGKGYGPILVAREPLDPRAIAEKVVAIPGSHTTAALLLRLYVGDPPLIEVAFDKIPTAVLEGQADVGLLIHEGQITHTRMGLVKVLDLGEVWARETGLPLSLGVNVMRRDLGEDVHRRLGPVSPTPASPAEHAVRNGRSAAIGLPGESRGAGGGALPPGGVPRMAPTSRCQRRRLGQQLRRHGLGAEWRAGRRDGPTQRG